MSIETERIIARAAQAEGITVEEAKRRLNSLKNPSESDDTINEIERERRAHKIFDSGKKANAPHEEISKAITQDWSIEKWQQHLLEKNNSKSTGSRRRQDHFSLCRFLNNVLTNHRQDYLEEIVINSDDMTDGIESEKTRKLDGDQDGIKIPFNTVFPISKRDLTAGNEASAGVVVDDVLLGDSLIPSFNTTQPALMLATKMESKSSFGIPKHDGRIVAEFTGETAAASEQTPTFSRLDFKPHYFRAWVGVSKALIRQSSIDVENFVRQEFRNQMFNALHGTLFTAAGGTNEPLGFNNNNNIAEVTFPSASGPTVDTLYQAEETLANANVLETRTSAEGISLNQTLGGGRQPMKISDNVAWIVSPSARRQLRKLQMLAGGDHQVWQTGSIGNEYAIYPQAGSRRQPKVIGYNAYVTSSVDSSRMYFAKWDDLIVAYFSKLTIMKDPYTLATRGIARFICDIDLHWNWQHDDAVCRLRAV